MGWPWMAQWALLLYVAILVQVYGTKACLREEKAALLNYKRYLKSYNASVLPSWVYDPNSDCCSWESVICNSSSGHIIELSLHNILGIRWEMGFAYDASSKVSLNLSLFLPFKELRVLNLSNNAFIGSFPTEELLVLQNLELLDLSHNSLESLSTNQDLKALAKLMKLRFLDLNYNYLDDKIFKFIDVLPGLNSLLLKSNGIEAGFNDTGLCKIINLKELDLSDNMLNGTLPPCLGNLTLLRALDLSENILSGSIPSSLFAGLSYLQFLSLSDNSFKGLFSLSSFANHSKLTVLKLGKMVGGKFQVEAENPPWTASFQLEFLDLSSCGVNLATRTIPTFLLYQHELKYIDLTHNNLKGMFPSWLLANNTRLQVVLLSNNSFIGSFELPSSDSQHMDDLLHIDISYNQIRGELPKNIGFLLPHLKSLQVSTNRFHGDIPASIGEMSSLWVLNLANNNFSGKVPNHMLLGCVSLRLLRLSNDSLEGQIFPTPVIMESLMVLMLDNNRFNGTLGGGLFGLNRLEVLILSGNQLSGRLPSWIGDFSSLYYISVSGNKMEGAIPKELCKFRLDFMDLSNNRFSGRIPSCLHAYYLHLWGNALTGKIPEALLLRNPDLVSIDLGGNKFSGSIPWALYGLKHLQFLFLGDNLLEGQVPSQICQLEELSLLDLSLNNFTGFIPSCFNKTRFGLSPDAGGFTARVGLPTFDFFFYSYQYAHFDVGPTHVSVDYSLEVRFTTKRVRFSYTGSILQYMSGLDLSGNRFTGEIPNQIGDLIALHALNLSNNYLNGSIPESFHKLQQIESLDLSFNNLSRSIPLQLQDLHSLSFFNVSYNNLSGTVPNQGQFGTFDQSSYMGNPHLFLNNSNRGVATPPPPPTLFNHTDKNESTIDFTAFYWSFAASYVTILLMMVTILWINPYWRRLWLYHIETCLYKCFGRFLENAFY